MKKISFFLLIVLVGCSCVFLGFDYTHNIEPNHYYQVYLDDELIGTIKSKKELEKYIDKRGEYIKNKYNVDKIYRPNGLEIKKVTTYDDDLMSVQDIYNHILEQKAFTIKGYQFTINNGDDNQKIYVLDKNIFETAIESTIKAFVGTDKYNNYKNEEQEEIKTTGTYVNNIYVENDITLKEVDVPVNEQIYIDASELTKYLLFGTTNEQKVYTVQVGDTIPKVAFNNQIGIEEFLISNPEFTSENNLLFPGQQVTIGVTNPQIRVVIEEKSVSDEEDKYQVNETVNDAKLKGDDTIIQQGENGLSRVTRVNKTVNGVIIYSDTKKREVLKPSVDEIIERGGKVIPNVGLTTSWGWPTNPGYIITDRYVWRINPVTYKRELHSGIDIAGTGYYSPIYATNNGTIENIKSTYDYGNHVIINHNNGYYTLYAHMAAFAPNIKVGDTVARGQIIGYMGMTGYATGVHVHYEIWQGCKFCRIDPLSKY